MIKGEFLKNDQVDGTHASGPWFDEDTARITGGDGLVLGFSAPIQDSQGNLIGIWHNRADFSFVEETIVAGYRDFAQNGFTSADLRLLDQNGVVLVDYDPIHTGDRKITRDRAIILKGNLAAEGLQAARDARLGQRWLPPKKRPSRSTTPAIKVTQASHQHGRLSSFSGVQEHVRERDARVAETTHASGEQSKGIGEINNSDDQMDTVTPSNAATAEENAASPDAQSAICAPTPITTK